MDPRLRGNDCFFNLMTVSVQVPRSASSDRTDKCNLLNLMRNEHWVVSLPFTATLCHNKLVFFEPSSKVRTIYMNAFESAIHNALVAQGNNQEANKAYLEFLKANFIIPIEKNTENDPQVLYLVEDGINYLPLFSSMIYLDSWATAIKDEISLLKLSGVDLLKGLGESTYISLNLGSDLYKEFNPSELARMRSMVLKLFKK